jgi:hypothetical protein
LVISILIKNFFVLSILACYQKNSILVSKSIFSILCQIFNSLFSPTIAISGILVHCSSLNFLPTGGTAFGFNEFGIETMGFTLHVDMIFIAHGVASFDFIEDNGGGGGAVGVFNEGGGGGAEGGPGFDVGVFNKNDGGGGGGAAGGLNVGVLVEQAKKFCGYWFGLAIR